MDDGERSALVVADEVLNVLEEESARLVLLDDPCDVEEERALGIAPKPVLPTEGVFLRYAGDGKRLARKSRQQDVMLRDVGGGDCCDVARDVVFAVEIGAIGLLAEAIPLAGEHATPANRVESPTHTTDAREQVYEREPVRRTFLLPHDGRQVFERCLSRKRLAVFPAIDGPQ